MCTTPRRSLLLAMFSISLTLRLMSLFPNFSRARISQVSQKVVHGCGGLVQSYGGLVQG